MDFSTYQRPEIEPDQFSGITERFKNVFRVWEWTKLLMDRVYYKCCRLCCNTQEQTLLDCFSALTEWCCNETLLQNRDKASNSEYLA